MITDPIDSVKVKTNIEGEKGKFSFDENSLVHIMSILTDLYSDPEMAVLREYSTNAYDAHVEAGQTRPIEVDIPTSLQPSLKIRDFGVGLSLDDVRNIYSKYGASTKRETNEQVGMLGLGCKSALTYTNQFFILSVKDGWKVQVLVAREEDGSVSFTVVEHEETTDDNGTEIVIPAKTYNDFNRKAHDLFQYWPEGSVLINGQPPFRIVTENENVAKITDNIFLVRRSHYSERDTLVMGNVPYPTDFKARHSHDWRIVAFAPIGAVNFTPSRESLYDTKKTKAFIESVSNEFAQKIIDLIQRRIDEAKTHGDAVMERERWLDALGLGSGLNAASGYTYKGVEMPVSITEGLAGSITAYTNSARLSDHTYLSENGYINLYHWISGGVIVTGYDAANFTPTHKKKLRQWRANGHYADIHSRERFLLVKEDLTDIWLKDVPRIKWSDVSALKLDRNSYKSGYGSKKIAGSYKAIQDGVIFDELDANDIDTENPVLWSTNLPWSYRSILDKMYPDGYACVHLPSNRIDKFLRNFPNCQNISDSIKEGVKKFLDSISEEQKIALFIQNEGTLRDYRRMDPDRVLDPDLKKLAKSAKVDVQAVVEELKVWRDHCNLYYSIYEPLREQIASPLSNYPLFDSYKFGHNLDHVYDYLNWHYETNLNPNKDK